MRIAHGPCVALLAVAGMASPSAAQVSYEAWFPGTSSVTEEEVVPLAYRGNWASSAQGCSDPNAIEKISIYPRGVDYYESGGRLDRVTQSGQDRAIKLKLSYEGEGGFWDRIEIWTLNAKGDQLSMTDDDGANAIVWYRCAP